jgi:hypothetical protein
VTVGGNARQAFLFKVLPPDLHPGKYLLGRWLFWFGHIPLWLSRTGRPGTIK